MKKIIAFLMAALMLSLCLAGCGPKGKNLAAVQEAGKLTVATSPDFAPFESLEGGKVVGFGTHDELIESNDIYREVYESQVKGGEENE